MFLPTDKLIWLIATGLGAGVLSGFFGIGGGIVIVPMLVYILGFQPSEATGTSLVALLLPVGILGVLSYYRAGKIGPFHVKAGLVLALGLFIGALFGAKLGVQVPAHIAKKSFAILLVAISIKIWFWG